MKNSSTDGHGFRLGGKESNDPVDPEGDSTQATFFGPQTLVQFAGFL